jgi:PAS domain-containing protein
MDWSLAAGLVLTAGFIAGASLLAIAALPDRRLRPIPGIFAEPTPATVLLFDGVTLVDATPSGRAMIADGVAEGPAAAWIRALSKLEPLFPGLVRRIEGLQREGRFVLCSRADVKPPLVLRAEYLGGLTRLTLLDGDGEAQLPPVDSAAETAMQEEVAMLRETLTHAPMLIWRESAEGEVIWANGAYFRTAATVLEPGRELSWPLPAVFPAQGGARENGARRVLRLDGIPHWYELSMVPLHGERLFFAQPADKLVQAEANLRDFMQTLTKTFAHLPIGLAIFDSQRVLQLFNPALIDLTGMSAEFLISRPTLAMLLDGMREKAMIPEPKDYRSWRKRIVELEQAAASGLFEDTWTLPSGQTYRVTGRPHPNGALAFMFEDISTEMMRTRRYRADLELSQAVIDAMEDAVVVFTQDSNVAMSNRAASALWTGMETAMVPVVGESSVIALWREMSAPTLLWNDLADYVSTFGPREPWDGELRLKDGRLLLCRVSPMPHGSTLVSFRLAERRVPPLELGGGKAVMIA